MYLAITGDMHGDWKKLQRAVNEVAQSKNLQEEGCLIITGDFGFILWNPEEEKVKLEEYSKKLACLNITVLFLMGNHENYRYFSELPAGVRFGNTVTNVTPNGYIAQLHTGCAYSIGGKKIFVFGGAASLDIPRRIAFEQDGGTKTWWAEELPTQEQYELGNKNLMTESYTFDVILTHTAPISAKAYLAQTGLLDGWLNVQAEAPLNNYLEYVYEQISASSGHKTTWFFGHFHLDHKFELANTKFRAILEDVIKV